jgi:hypothetical protein
MQTPDQLKSEAAREADTIEINWESLDDPTYRNEFELTLRKASELIPELEGLYTKLTSGKSVLTPDEDTPLNYTDLEKYTELVGEELFSGYVLAAVYEKYQKINDILALANEPQ